MIGQPELQLGQKQLLIGVRLGIARKDQNATIGGRHPHIDPLDWRELLQGGTRGQSRGQRLEAMCQGDLQAVGDEGHLDMGLDAFVGLVVNGANGQVALELLECLLDLGKSGCNTATVRGDPHR